MADLNPLVRVRKHVIEQKQKALAELYRQAEELSQSQERLETQLALESEKAKDMDAELRGFFEPYARSVKERISYIDEDRRTLELRIMAAQDDMRDSYAELKKVEIIDQRRTQEERDTQDKKDSAILDEIALDAFRRDRGS